MADTTKLTHDEAARLIDTYCVDAPLDDALDRALEYGWTFDPREPGALEPADQQDEADRVLYGTADANRYEIVSLNRPELWSTYGVTYAHKSSAMRAARKLMANAAEVGIYIHRLGVGEAR